MQNMPRYTLRMYWDIELYSRFYIYFSFPEFIQLEFKELLLLYGEKKA